MRRLHGITRARSTSALRLALAGVACAAAFAPAAASAQPIDTAPPLPNVLLLLDTSGSMEQMMDGSNAEVTANNPMPGLSYGAACTGNAQSSPNRWGVAVQALTGDFNTYGCVRMPRSPGSAFDTEYSIGGSHPYDLGYYLDYHRPAQPIDATHACVIGHNGTSTGWPAAASPNPPQVNSDFAAAGLTGYTMDLTTSTYTLGGTCSFLQQNNGALDAAAQMVRFGLMTFDGDPEQQTGVTVSNAAPLTFTNATNPFLGGWSYFDGWDQNASSTATHGRPAGCTSDPFFELGARNPAAPPWEGRMIRFPDPAVPSQLGIVNAQVQLAINAVRPYGANPIAGMMDDAKYYFWQDAHGPNALTGGDPQAQGGCRSQYIILFTHAAPNLELQPYCQGTGGKCPYDYAENIAYGLSHGTYSPSGTVQNVQTTAASGPKVYTYVVGFSISNFTRPDGTAGSCNDVLNSDGSVNTTICDDPAQQGTYGSCCTLEKIAVAGGTQKAYFADSKGALDNALGAILGDIAKEVTTRTTPVATPASGTVGSAGGSQSAVFYSSFSPSPAAPWSGNVRRQRNACSFSGGAFAAQSQAIDQNLGDDFAKNMDLDHTTQRHVLLVQPYAAGAVTRQPKATIRPYMNGPGSPSATGTGFDNLTLYDGTEYEYDYSVTASGAVISTSEITPDALSISGCPVTIPGTPAPGTAFDNTSCETIAFNFALGVRNGPSSWPSSSQTFPARFYNPADRIVKSSFGDVYHSTPAIVPPPGALLRDDSYQSFVANYTTLYHSNGDGKPRRTVLYVATNDGLLHAFGTDFDATDNTTFNTLKNNELWSFIPPAAMPALIGQFPSSHQIVLDGPPVVKDTVYQRTSSTASGDWHTTLVAGFGQGGAGYYALDVTDPEVTTRGSHSFAPVHATSNTSSPKITAKTGPHFLWQLTDPVLFGSVSATPAITTVFADPGDANGGGVREIGVAILPGGGAPLSAGACPRSPNTALTGTTLKKTQATPIGTNYANSLQVRKWASAGCTAAVPGRSVSVVRLDTGEVIRTFMRHDTAYEPSVDVPSASWALLTANSGASGTNTAGYKFTGRVIDTPLDSPMSGTPSVYPADVGAVATKFFIGDADGTVWRFDISSQNPDEWYGEVYLDSFNVTGQSSAGFASDTSWGSLAREPLATAPLLSLDRVGNIAVSIGTGDQNAIGAANTYPNFVWSTSETPQNDPNTGKTKLRAQVNWYKPLLTGEMVSGPMAIFNGTWMFTSYLPAASTSACQLGVGRFWMMDFTTPYDTSNPPSTGGLARLPDPSSTGSFRQSLDVATSIIPGVLLTSSLVCATADAVSDPYVGGTHLQTNNVTSSSMTATLITGGVGTKLTNVNQTLPTPRQSTIVDSWAAIME